MTLKSDAKVEKKLIYFFKNDKNLVNLDPSTQKPQEFALWLGPILQSIQVLALKKYKRVFFMKLKNDAKL